MLRNEDVRIIVQPNANVPQGRQVLWRRGRVIWWGPLTAPTEDVDYDAVTINPADYDSFLKSLRD